MMFLAHFSNMNLEAIMEWPLSKIDFWYNEAYPLYKKLNPEQKIE